MNGYSRWQQTEPQAVEISRDDIGTDIAFSSGWSFGKNSPPFHGLNQLIRAIASSGT
jgi:hypothetical protein